MAQAVAQRLALPAAAAGRAAPAVAAWLLGFAPVTRAGARGRRLRHDHPQPGRDRRLVDPGARLPRRRDHAGAAVAPAHRWPPACSPRSASGVGSDITTSESPERTLGEVARIATYLGVLLLGLMTLDRRRAPTVLARRRQCDRACCRPRRAVAVAAGACSRRTRPVSSCRSPSTGSTGRSTTGTAWPRSARSASRSRSRSRPAHRQRRRPRAQRGRAARARALHQPDDLARRDRRRRRRRRGPPRCRSDAPPRPRLARPRPAWRARSSWRPRRSADWCTRTCGAAPRCSRATSSPW